MLFYTGRAKEVKNRSFKEKPNNIRKEISFSTSYVPDMHLKSIFLDGFNIKSLQENKFSFSILVSTILYNSNAVEYLGRRDVLNVLVSHEFQNRCLPGIVQTEEENLQFFATAWFQLFQKWK